MDGLVVYGDAIAVEHRLDVFISDSGVLPPAGRYEGSAQLGLGEVVPAHLHVRAAKTIGASAPRVVQVYGVNSVEGRTRLTFDLVHLVES